MWLQVASSNSTFVQVLCNPKTALKSKDYGAGEIAQQLKALTVLAEKLGSIPSLSGG